MIEGAARLDKDLTRAPQYTSLLEQMGFVDVVEKTFCWTSNEWPKGEH
jgi:hypothetical protein